MNFNSSFYLFQFHISLTFFQFSQVILFKTHQIIKKFLILLMHSNQFHALIHLLLMSLSNKQLAHHSLKISHLRLRSLLFLINIVMNSLVLIMLLKAIQNKIHFTFSF